MSKAMLIMDMPKCCDRCLLKVKANYGTGKCVINDSVIGDIHRRQDWCPLREAPRKITERTRLCNKWYAQGYNACVDEILNKN